MNQKLFVIMPINRNEVAQEKIKILRKVSNSYGWFTHLPIYDPEAPVFNLRETICDMQTSDLVFADLTGERPSCYYELGLAEALRLPIFALAERGSPIHQTSIRGEVQTYSSLDEFEHLVERALSTH